MSCPKYGPLVSRYLDDELEIKELEAFIDHLSECRACQVEIGSMERLRGWLRAADSFHGFPEPNMDQCVEALLYNDKAGKESKSVVQEKKDGRRHSAAGEVRPASSIWAWLGRLFPVYPPLNKAWRFALPLLVVGLIGFWMIDENSGNWVDVQDISSAQVSSVSSQVEEDDEVDVYVIEHAMQQPWVSYGDELPRVELVSGTYR